MAADISKQEESKVLAITSESIWAVCKANAALRSRIEMYEREGLLSVNEFCTIATDGAFIESFVRECWMAFLEPKFLLNRLSALTFSSPLAADAHSYHLVYPRALDKRSGFGCFSIGGRCGFDGAPTPTHEPVRFLLRLVCPNSWKRDTLEECRYAVERVCPGAEGISIEPSGVDTIEVGMALPRPDLRGILPLVSSLADNYSKCPLKRIWLDVR